MTIQDQAATPIIACIDCDENVFLALSSIGFEGIKWVSFEHANAFFAALEKQEYKVVAIISQSEVLGTNGISLLEMLNRKKGIQLPYFLVSQQLSASIAKHALKAGVADVFRLPIKRDQVATRLPMMIENWAILRNPNTKGLEFGKYKTPLIKRAFDIFFAGMAILLLSPVLLVVCILLKLESKGPIFYYALRVGSGYRTFKFYKFRSMFVNADQRLKDLKHLNQYNVLDEANAANTANAFEEILCSECKAAGTGCRFPIYSDTIRWCEKQYNDNRKAKAGSAFFKLKDDPRITRVGKFIRNSSIDELPQLWNVIIGDMSIVGNRPLPLYEAEKLTTDKYAMRFMAPAGITGLWQVEKRGKGEMSEDERLMLDNKYAENHSFLNDIKLILRTIPALLQSESV